MCEYGTPKIIQSDNGMEFANQLISELMNLHGIEQQLITAYNLQANGLVERTNQEESADH